MRLISVTVRNYRVHRELTLEFDASRTLVGGPNEAGKSTLIEAVHRALFFPARSTAEPQRRMRSTLHPGHPEVELAFESGGRIFNLQKRFSGPNGTATLTETGKKSWHGAEAEEQLARILNVPSEPSAKAAVECWAHLWVWQGASGANPETHVTSQHDALIARLQDAGGGGAMQSDMDATVAKHFKTLLERTYTLAGKPKAGSDLEAAETEAQAAEAAWTEASQRVLRLRQAVQDVEQADQTLAAAEASLSSLAAEHATVSAKQEQVVRLKAQLEKDDRRAREAALRLDDVRQAHAQIAELERKLKTLRESLAPVQIELAKLDAARAARTRSAGEAEAAAKSVAEQVRNIHLRRELAAAQALVFEKRLEQQELSERVAQGRAVEEELFRQRNALAQLPVLDAAQVRKLQHLESETATAAAALAAMAAGLDVLASEIPITVGQHVIGPGDTHIVTEDTEVRIGGGTVLRIRPGGGRSLSEARNAVDAARQRLQRALDLHGLASVPAAVEVATRRDALAAQVKSGEARLGDFNLASLAARLARLGETLAATDGQIARLSLEAPDTPVPADLTSARLAAATLDREFAEVQAAERRAQTVAESTRQACREAEDQFEQKRQACEQRGREVTTLEAQGKLLVETHGDAAARAERIDRAQGERETADRAAGATRRSLDELQPELLAGSATRLQRAIEEKRRAIQQADTQKAVALALLSNDGTRDPAADLAQCEARLRFARERQASARRRAAAIKLLHDLFREEQHRLADQFTRPLADRITTYLRCIFGSGARFGLSLQEKSFSELQLMRSDGLGAVSFESLSGGTREQVAAAVRLATAELLAVNHGGCLPVVFDDAFAYSDPGRVKVLQDMLDLAARRGLQIIVLTCNPADYAGLGARELQVTRAPGNAARESAVEASGGGRSGLAGSLDATSAAAPSELLRTVLRKTGR